MEIKMYSVSLNIVPQPSITLYYRTPGVSLSDAKNRFQHSTLKEVWLVCANNRGEKVSIRTTDVYAYQFKDDDTD